MTVLAPNHAQGSVLTDLLASSTHDQYLRGQLNRLRCGIVFCDADARVHWLNRSAERLLADGPLRIVGSRLGGDSEADTDKLMNELAKSAVGNTVRYLRLGQAERSLHLAIQASAPPSTMALTLTSPNRSVDIPIEALTQLFGLTPTEAGLLAALSAGSTLQEYARERCAWETARVHLKRIKVKTGVHRQSDLVRLVLSCAAAHLSVGAADPAES